MKTSILSPQHFITSQWSGGSTTELYISPAKASYSERNFEFRISTAKVEVEESTFTSLPGIHRTLMVLEGEINITHEGQYHKQLKPYDVDTFSGNWNTSALGTCTDFNVMTSGPQQIEIYHLSMGATSSYELKPKTVCTNLFLYATSGSVHFQLLEVDYNLETGNVLLIENLSVPSIFISSADNFGLVVLEVN